MSPASSTPLCRRTAARGHGNLERYLEASASAAARQHSTPIKVVSSDADHVELDEFIASLTTASSGTMRGSALAAVTGQEQEKRAMICSASAGRADTIDERMNIAEAAAAEKTAAAYVQCAEAALALGLLPSTPPSPPSGAIDGGSVGDAGAAPLPEAAIGELAYNSNKQHKLQ